MCQSDVIFLFGLLLDTSHDDKYALSLKMGLVQLPEIDVRTDIVVTRTSAMYKTHRR